MYMLRHKNEQSFHKIHLHREPTAKAHTHTHTHTHVFTQQDTNAFTTSISRSPNIKGRQANKTQSHKTKGENT